MKKIVFLSLLALCLPWTLAAQSVDDDLYYVPSKKKAEQKTEKAEEETVRKAPEKGTEERGDKHLYFAGNYSCGSGP